VIIDWLANLNPIVQALLATCFTWFVTALGASAVFFFKQVNRTVLDGMLGFAAGVMIAASYWSLLAPAIELAEQTSSLPPWVPATVGFLLGGAFLWAVDRTLPHLHLGLSTDEAEGIPTSWQRSILLVLAITMHNFPEGLATFLSALQDPALGSAIAVAIALHNIPEGISVSVPIYFATGKRGRAFLYSVLSGMSEPVGAAIAYIALRLFLGGEGGVIPPQLTGVLFAGVAGIMVYISLDELLPTSRAYGKGHDSLLGLVTGMVVMSLSLLLMR